MSVGSRCSWCLAEFDGRAPSSGDGEAEAMSVEKDLCDMERQATK